MSTPIQGPTGDDDAMVMGALQMEIHSNCQVAFGSGNSPHWRPDLDTMLNTNPVTALYAWGDLDPSATGSGQIWYEENGWDYQVTYDGVFEANSTRRMTVQFRGNRGYNDHVIAFGTNVLPLVFYAQAGTFDVSGLLSATRLSNGSGPRPSDGSRLPLGAASGVRRQPLRCPPR